MAGVTRNTSPQEQGNQRVDSPRGRGVGRRNPPREIEPTTIVRGKEVQDLSISTLGQTSGDAPKNQRASLSLSSQFPKGNAQDGFNVIYAKMFKTKLKCKKKI